MSTLIADFQFIEAKWQSVDNGDLDNLDRIYTKLLLWVPCLLGEIKIFERLLKNAKSINNAKLRSETIEWKKVYGNMDEAKAESDRFYEDEEIELIRASTEWDMYKNAIEAVSERIKAIKIFLSYGNKTSFNS